MPNLIPLFQKNNPSFLIDSVLEGWLGTAYADDPINPQIAMLVYADVIILAGNPDHPLVDHLIQLIPMEKGILPPPVGWQTKLTQTLGAGLVSIKRYAYADDHLDPNHLTKLAHRLKQPYQIKKINAMLAQEILNLPAALPNVEKSTHAFG